MDENKSKKQIAAGSSKTETLSREEEQALVFGRRDSLQRSPVRRLESASVSGNLGEEAPTGSDVDQEIFWQEDTFGSSVLNLSESDGVKHAEDAGREQEVEEGDFIAQRKRNKRKRWESSLHGQEPKKMEVDATEFKNLMEKLRKSSERLGKLVGSNPNTQRGIKREIEDLAYIVESVNRRCGEWESSPMIGQPVTPTKEEKETKIEELKTTKQTREWGTQTYCIEPEELERATDFDTTAALLLKEWPEDMYKATGLKKGSPTNYIEEKDIALVIDPEDDGTGKTMSLMKEKFPEAKELLNTLRDGELEYLMRATKTYTSRGDDKERTGYVYLLPHTKEVEEEKETKKMYTTLVKLKETLVAEKRREITIALIEGMDRDRARKMLECVLHGTDIKAIILYAEDKRVRSGYNRQKSRLPVETVTVRAEGKSYAELLRTVKDNIDIGQIGVNISGIRKSVRGDGVIFTVEEGKGMARTLKENIAEKIQVDEVRAKTNGKILFLTGVDAAVTAEEIAETIGRETGEEQSNIQVKTLKQGNYGSQSATLELPELAARNLATKGNIKIGWTSCKIRERITLTRCYRCLEFGHRSQECKGEDLSQTCIKCGKDGHRARECTEQPYCTKCKVSGHRSDQTRCPDFRRLLEASRNGNRRR
ncbi:unnamed protein product [Phaedon cochleariae]|uniref:CCHC-type domain-containing protein n=1 Tax=Phaedon cochleariae TaxID=80249 RepID=A0A9P0DRU1_PHACE|nr:unnamed protein product [Phaedon cochleariae]